MDKITAAVIQAGSYLFDTQRTIEKVRTYCQDAADAGARLVVFPEAFLGGYPKGIHAWPLARRNVWFAGFNIGHFERHKREAADG